MGLFKRIKQWFFPPCEYRDSLAALIAYLPIGNLYALGNWAETWIPYRSDTDTGKPDGKYDYLQEYNGADLTIKAKSGDCESIAAVLKEVISSPEWTAKGWAAEHICMVYANGKAHDVCFFNNADGRRGWFNGGDAIYGAYSDMREFFASYGDVTIDWWVANDLGEQVASV